MLPRSERAQRRSGGLSRLPIASKLLLISGVYVAIIAGLTLLGSLSLGFQASVRAFVGGEGLWSKAQKDAVHHLIAYTLLQREEDFERYRASMAVPLGDRKARLALAQEVPDLELADQGFIEGRNHPEDVRGMSLLFLRFGWWSYLAEAIEIWGRADGVIDELVQLGGEVRTEVTRGSMTRERQVEIIARIDDLNRRFTALEDDFSFTLGRAARLSRVATGVAMVLLTALALAAGLWLSLRISREIGGGVLRLRDGARRVAAGDFSQRIAVGSADEIGELAQGFNQMTDSLVAQIGEIERKEKALAEMDRLKTQFFANVSHELRTPLSLLLGPAGRLAANPGLGEKERESARSIERSAALLLKHVNDLLDLSRLDAGRMAIDRSATDLARLVRLVGSHFDLLAAERRLHFEIEAPAALVAEVDREKVERVLFNLLSNAFKFTPESAWIRLACRAIGDGGDGGAGGAGGDQVELVVEDGGPGVPEELRSAIFERFRQGDGDTTRRHGGTGLGLAIAREFVDLHGGSIRVESAAGGGARLVVELPLRAPAGDSVRSAERATERKDSEERIAELARQYLAEPRAVEKGSGERPAAGSSGALVLVVEDNAEMNRFLLEVLGERFRVEGAFDGKAGLARALELKPDLIVSDIMMPVMSGDQLLRAVRGEPSLEAVPFLVLTARADEGLRVRLLREGAQDFMVKPFLPSELVTRAENLVAIKRTRDSIEGRLDEQSRAAGELARVAADQRAALFAGFEKLSRSESRLRVALAEKEVLVREIHHRVKNNLQVVSSLLNLHTSETSAGEAQELLRRCADRVRAMALLHEALYRRADVGRVDLGEYLGDVVASVRGSYTERSRIRVEIVATEIVVDAETAMPCGLILHELLVNAFRHAFPGGAGTVRVRVERQPGGQPRLTVEDDGCGLPDGFNIDRVETLGLQLVTSLAAQVGARIDVRSDRGTAFRLELAA